MLRKLLTAVIVVFSLSSAFSQDSTKTFTLSGSADAYYRYNFQNAKKSGEFNNKTSFTNSQNSFELGMASLKAEYTGSKTGAVVDLGFGTRAAEFSYNDDGVLAAIKQAYVTYSPADKVKFSLGKWGTHVGYELLDAYLNRNYSMSYMFSYGPFFHTGLKADITVNKNFAFMVGVANPTDYTSANFSKKHFIGQIHLNTINGKLGGYVNYMGGKDWSNASMNQLDAVITGIISSKFNIGYNGTVKYYKPEGGKTGSFSGSALYLNYDPTSVFGLTARGEIFNDKDNVAGLNTQILAGTLSGNIHLGNLTIIPEFRVDAAKDPIFFKSADAEDAPSLKRAGQFILAATYHF